MVLSTSRGERTAIVTFPKPKPTAFGCKAGFGEGEKLDDDEGAYA